MKKETRYGVMGIKHPVMNLLKVPHKGKALTVSLLPYYTKKDYPRNLEILSQKYIHPVSREEISFIPSTTSESLSVVGYEFGEGNEYDAIKYFSENHQIYLGPCVLTDEGVFTNTTIQNVDRLKDLRSKCEMVNGIYLLPNDTVQGVRDFAFVPRETFENIDRHNPNSIARSGIARGLEYDSGKVAKNLERISSNKFFNGGVHFFGDIVGPKQVELAVATLTNYPMGDKNLLEIHMNPFNDGSYKYSENPIYAGGSAFGVLKK